MKQQRPKPPPHDPQRTASSSYAEIASRHEATSERSRIPQRRRIPKFDQQAYIKQTVRELLPEILVPLIKILIEVTSIPGDCRQKIARVNEVAHEAIQNACQASQHHEGYTTEEDDNDYNPIEPEDSEDSEVSEDSVVSNQTDEEELSEAELPVNRPIQSNATQNNEEGLRRSQRTQRSTH